MKKPSRYLKPFKFEGNGFERPKSLLLLRKVFNLILISGLTIIFLFDPLLVGYAQWLSPSVSDPHGDIALVLFAANSDGLSRLALAAKLLKEGKVQAIYMDTVDRTYKEKYDSVLAKYDVASEKVFLGDCKIETTFDHARVFNQTVRKNDFQFHRILITYSPYSLRRAHWLFQLILGSDIEINTYVTPQQRNYLSTRSRWWRNEARRNSISSETQKIIFYWIYYGLLGHRDGKEMTFQDVFRIRESSYDYTKWWKTICPSDF